MYKLMWEINSKALIYKYTDKENFSYVTNLVLI